MALKLSHDAGEFAYSSFMRFRTKLARCYGIPLPLMENYYGGGKNNFGYPFSMIRLACEGPAREFGALDQLEELESHFPLKWSSFKPNPIHDFLNHSDYNGIISYESCGLIAAELRILIATIESGIEAQDQEFISDLTRLMKGCAIAHNRQENLEFR